MFKPFLLVLLVGVSIVADPLRKDPPQSDLAGVQGHWRVTSATQNGRTETYRETELKVTSRDRYTVLVGNEVFLTGSFRLDPSTRPRRLDFTGVVAEQKDEQQFHAIYELNGDTMRICAAKRDEARPTDFRPKEGSGQILWVFKRMKP